ncbi:MAG: hypothetical protein DYG94_01390 [Leptolyngbya sp. PLA3]|nr:MAG: hypothetical protein EDM82_00490 [Cyanobacteria bacterium CYA]MCE7967385.1 hypothetical protein [Leptolyngbya sp. PL-A3]
MKNFNVILGAAVMSCLLPGCMYRPGGAMMSLDRFTYESTVYEPKTLTLIDTRTSEVLWTMEVPVGQRVTVEFYENKSKGYADYPDVMRWEVQKADALDSVLRSQISVPDRWSRRLDMTLREVPEFYPGAEASATP